VYFCGNDIVWGKGSMGHQAHDTEQPNLSNMMIGLPHLYMSAANKFAGKNGKK